MLMSDEWERIKDELLSKLQPTQWVDVIMPLSALAEESFWNENISTGNVSMLSEGVIGVDSVYGLTNGVLRLNLSREVYERVGLQGKPTQFGNMKHLKNRWMIEIDMCSPKFKKGEKMYDRIKWCFENTLAEPVRWLMARDKGFSEEALKTMVKYHPVVHTSIPLTLELKNIHIPHLQIPDDDESEEGFSVFAQEIYEHFSLLSLASARMNVSDKIDPYLARMSPLPSTEGSIVKISWNGLLGSSWVEKLLVELLRATSPTTWLYLQAHGFKNAINSWDSKEHGRIGAGENAVAILRFPWHDSPAKEPTTDTMLTDQERNSKKRLHYISWEIIDAFDGHS
jgi:ribonuclease P/MRP protein subunit RPP40